ncbi:hypothetical protein M409DRAFT_52260 [Zasmidium cellare ATCC 36951]|uniref:Uncharacterized protein n=1 Tax=Zasmidium cellare ATCC 36951 TaxID=1080233 RepID=A0A6A6CRG9_ZASCE|nr:uncharacterized protein M409DRAFT_52260 [Zasmidium cellare ATCC 36951]KAF2169754.1 hypothetical protein M409DRAFT_52260 [Zasmidium cellare ATCC 36951]
MSTTPEDTKVDSTTTPTLNSNQEPPSAFLRPLRPSCRHFPYLHPNNPSDTSSTTQAQQQQTGILHDESIPVATKFSRLAEQHESTERARSRSRGPDPLDGEVRRSSAADVRRSSVWSQDKEKKQRSKVQKLMDHHWVPDFLK